MRALFYLLAFCALVSSASAQAFGAREGMMPSDFSWSEHAYNNTYLVMPPTPNPIFGSYRAIIDPSHGLCSITGEFGHAEGKIFEMATILRRMLTRRYGPPSMDDMGDTAEDIRAFKDTNPPASTIIGPSWGFPDDESVRISLNLFVNLPREMSSTPLTLTYQLNYKGVCSLFDHDPGYYEQGL